MFRHKPAEVFFKKAQEKNVGIIARVPLASGLFTGKMTKNTKFSEDDHRHFNRNGESFDKGETFSGVPYDIGLEAVEALKNIKPIDITLAQFTLKWILMNDNISCVIPGGRTPKQVLDNTQASSIPNLTDELMKEVEGIYNKFIKDSVHNLW